MLILQKYRNSSLSSAQQNKIENLSQSRKNKSRGDGCLLCLLNIAKEFVHRQNEGIMGKKFAEWWMNSQMSFGNRISGLVLMIGAGAAFLLTIVFGIVYHRTVLRDYRSEIQSHLRDTDTVFNSYVENTEAWVNSLYRSSEGTLARIDREFDMMDHVSYLNYVREMMTSYGYIHSVYFLDREGEISLWIKGIGSYTKDLDRELLNAQIYGRTITPFVWKLPYRYDENEISILSFLYNEVPRGMGEYTGAVIVNVELTELQKKILNENNNARELFMVNAEGIVTLHSSPAHIGEDWSDQESVQMAISGTSVFDLHEKDGHFEYLCLPSEVDGFYLIARSEFTSISVFSEAFLIVPIICLGLILVIAVLSVIMGKRMARPITQTVEEIRQSGMGEKLEFLSEDDRDEIRFLQKYTSHVNQYMEDVLENDQMNRIIYNLIRNDRTVDIQPYLLEKGVLRENAGYCVVTAEFGCQYEVTDMEELNSIRKSISRQVRQILGKYGHCTSYEHGLRYLLFLLSEETEKEIPMELLCKELRKNCETLMKENTFTDVYLAVSRRLDSSVSCKEEVRRNNERMEARTIYQEYGVELVPEYSERDKPQDKTVETCTQALKNRDKDGYLEAVEQMIRETRGITYPQFINWVIGVTEKIREVKAVINRNYVKPDRAILYDQVQQIYSLDSLRKWFEVLYEDVNEKMDQIRNTSTVSLMEDAVDYILENFGDSQLGVMQLARQFHISAQYFGRLFLEFTGQSVSDYIIQVRMEKARNFLLAKPDLEIMEVAKRVGYHSASYFSTAFKKYYGVTPSKLRSSLNIPGREKDAEE